VTARDQWVCLWLHVTNESVCDCTWPMSLSVTARDQRVCLWLHVTNESVCDCTWPMSLSLTNESVTADSVTQEQLFSHDWWVCLKGMPFLQGSFAKEPYFRSTLLATIPCRMPKSESASLYSVCLWDCVATRCSCSFPHSEGFWLWVSCRTATHSPDVCKNRGSFTHEIVTREWTVIRWVSCRWLLSVLLYVYIYMYIYVYIYTYICPAERQDTHPKIGWVSCQTARHSTDFRGSVLPPPPPSPP